MRRRISKEVRILCEDQELLIEFYIDALRNNKELARNSFEKVRLTDEHYCRGWTAHKKPEKPLRS